MRYLVKNWLKFQHYTNRRPPWIKLYRDLLDDCDFLRLRVASRALAPLLWLLASESADGTIDGDIGKLAFRLRLSESEIKDGINGLLQSSYISCKHDASDTLAPCKQDAMLEREREKEKETETETEGGVGGDGKSTEPPAAPAPVSVKKPTKVSQKMSGHDAAVAKLLPTVTETWAPNMQAFCDYRRSLGVPLTEHTLQRLIRQMRALPEWQPAPILDYTIEREWERLVAQWAIDEMTKLGRWQEIEIQGKMAEMRKQSAAEQAEKDRAWTEAAEREAMLQAEKESKAQQAVEELGFDA